MGDESRHEYELGQDEHDMTNADLKEMLEVWRNSFYDVLNQVGGLEKMNEGLKEELGHTQMKYSELRALAQARLELLERCLGEQDELQAQLDAMNNEIGQGG